MLHFSRDANSNSNIFSNLDLKPWNKENIDDVEE